MGRSLKEVEQVLQTLQEHDLYLKPDKYKFHRTEIDFLGMVIEGGQVKMDPVRVEGIAKWPAPTSVKELRAFLGFRFTKTSLTTIPSLHNPSMI